MEWKIILLAVVVAALLYDVAEAHGNKKRKQKKERHMEHAMPHRHMGHAMPHRHKGHAMPHKKGLLSLVSRHKNVRSFVTSENASGIIVSSSV